MSESLAEGGTAVRHGVWSVAPAMLALAVVGCGGPGQTVPLSVNMDAVPAPAKVTAPLRVAVVPFEDVRTDKSGIGRYQHYVESTVDRLVPASGSAADQITNFVVEYLKRSEEHTSELQSPCNLVCRLLLEKKKKNSKKVL